jgi:hypothetical protein
MGFNNITVFGIYNTKESDQKLIAALKEKQWDAVAIGLWDALNYSLILILN